MASALTRYALRQLLARLLGETITGTPSGNVLTVGSFDVAALSAYQDDYFNAWWGRFYTGTHKDTTFVVTDFQNPDGNGEKAVIYFEPDLSSAVETGDLFELYQDYSPAEMNDAINLAIAMVEEEALQDKVDASIQIAANTYEYNVPAGYTYIDEVFQESGTADRYSPSSNLIDVRHWRILHGASPKIWFDNAYANLTVGRNLRIVGQAIQEQLTVDTDTCAINQAYILYQAKANLHFARVDEEGDAHWNKMKAATSMALDERRRVRVVARGKKVRY